MLIKDDFFEKYSDFYRGKKILITGGLGFLGSNLAIALVKLGAEVTIQDALLELYGGNTFNIEPIKDKVELHISDIRDEASVNWLVKGKDLIFHIAAQTSHVDSMTDPFSDLDMNCRGSLILLEACRRFNPAAGIVYCGTRGQYGRLEHIPVSEDHRMNPTDIYGVNKMAAEMYHFIYHRVHNIRSVSLRVNNTYGPRHQMKHGKYGILNWFIRLAMDNGTIKVFGEGSQMRDYNYVDDVTRAFIMSAACDEAWGKAFNLGSGKPVAFIDMVRIILSSAGSGKMEQVPWPKDRADIEVGDYIADFNLIEKVCGWKPEVMFDQGLKETVEFYNKHREIYFNA
ncbi:MAG: GDP-mannose 4,6-dehydratase [Firmicutes bacterium]|nr:GDP-mannose 4,6-dehydratase [Bacillota bacterium]